MILLGILQTQFQNVQGCIHCSYSSPFKASASFFWHCMAVLCSWQVITGKEATARKVAYLNSWICQSTFLELNPKHWAAPLCPPDVLLLTFRLMLYADFPWGLSWGDFYPSNREEGSSNWKGWFIFTIWRNMFCPAASNVKSREATRGCCVPAYIRPCYITRQPLF